MLVKSITNQIIFCRSHEPSKDKIILLSEVDRSITKSYQIGALDFSEGAVASLLLDQASSITSTVVSADLIGVTDSKFNRLRPKRSIYYDVLDYDIEVNLNAQRIQDEIRIKTGIRSIEKIEDQVKEDSMVDEYWSKLFDSFIVNDGNIMNED